MKLYFSLLLVLEVEQRTSVSDVPINEGRSSGISSCMEEQNIDIFLSTEETEVLANERMKEIGRLYAYRHSANRVELRTSTHVGALTIAEGSYVCRSKNILTEAQINVTIDIKGILHSTLVGPFLSVIVLLSIRSNFNKTCIYTVLNFTTSMLANEMDTTLRRPCCSCHKY